MAISAQFDAQQLAALNAAIARNPAKVREEAQNFLVRGISLYNQSIIRAPWRMGGSGGGAPVAAVMGGNLRDTHVKRIGIWDAEIYPTAKYAPYVHGIVGYPRKRHYQLRPWLDYAKESKQADIEKLQEQTLENIINDLSR